MRFEDKHALINGEATIQTKIEILPIIGETEPIVITESDYIISWEYEDFRYVPNSGFIGQFVARTLTGQLKNMGGNFNIENRDIVLYLGIKVGEILTWYSLGNFLITEPKDNDVSDVTNFEAMDYAKKFNKEYVDNITYPCTALELAQNVCQQSGVIFGSTSFLNSDFVISNNQFVNGESNRDVMKAIGMLAFSFVRVDWDNKVYIDFDYDHHVDENDIITSANYYDLTTQKNSYGPVNRIIIGSSSVDGENVFIEDTDSITNNGLCELFIYDNPLTYNQTLRQLAIDNAGIVMDFRYRPMEATTTGHPWLLGNERIVFVGMENDDDVITFPFDRTISYNGHIKTKIESYALTTTDTKYLYKDTLDQRLKNTQVIVDKSSAQIEILSNEIVDISDEITGAGSIELINCSKTPLYKLIIKNACQLFPNHNLFPSSTTYPLGRYLRITHNDGTYERYYLPALSLRNYNGTYDELVIENNKVSITKKIGINNDGSLYILTTPITTVYDDIILYLNTGTNTVWLESFPNAILEATYLLANKYTDVFASQADVSAQIKVTTEEINLEVDKKVGQDEIISRINLSSEEIAIQSNKIRLEGLVTVNNKTSFNLDGSISTTDLRLANGGKVIGGDGLLANLQYNSEKSYLGQHTMSYEGVFINKAYLSLDVYIPNNFVIESAIVRVDVFKTLNNAILSDMSSVNNNGKVQNIRLYKNSSSGEYFVGWLGVFDPPSTLSEINGAFGINGFTASTIEKDDFSSVDIKNELTVGDVTNLVIETADPPLDYTDSNVILATQQMQIAYATLNIIGYISYE